MMKSMVDNEMNGGDVKIKVDDDLFRLILCL